MRYINSEDELKIYLKANLKESIVGGRPALIRTDIDWATTTPPSFTHTVSRKSTANSSTKRNPTIGRHATPCSPKTN